MSAQTFRNIQTISDFLFLFGFVLLGFIPFERPWMWVVSVGLFFLAISLAKSSFRKLTRKSHPRVSGKVLEIDTDIGRFRRAICTVEFIFEDEVIQIYHEYNDEENAVLVGQEVEVTVNREWLPDSEVSSLTKRDKALDMVNSIMFYLVLAAVAIFSYYYRK